MLVRLELEDLFNRQPRPPATDSAAIVTGLFREVLREDPDVDELQDFTGLLDRTSVNVVVATLYSSTAFRHQEVTGYYLEILGRAPTQSELAQRAFVHLQFVTGNDFRAAKIQETYQVVLGRQATTEEVGNEVGNWLFEGGLAGIGTDLLASSANISRMVEVGVSLPDMVAVNQLQQILTAEYTENSTGFVRLFDTYLKTGPSGESCETTCNTALLNLIRTGGSKKPDDVMKVFKKEKGLDSMASVQNYLWVNVLRMRQFNTPVPGVTGRGYMPQTPNGDLTTLMHLMENGNLSYSVPVVAFLG